MDHVDPLVIELIDSWPTIPAIVMSSTLDVLASNRLARALTPSFDVGTNIARFTFFSDFVQDGSPRAAQLSELIVEQLRGAADRGKDGTGLRDLVGELATRSDEFANVWALATESSRPMTVPISHPIVGDIVVDFHHLVLPGEPRLTLVVARVERGSVSEEKIFQLAAMIAAEDSDRS